jgi:DNA-binding transcriptional ArsR family regulator
MSDRINHSLVERLGIAKSGVVGITRSTKPESFWEGFATEKGAQATLIRHLQPLQEAGYLRIYREAQGRYFSNKPGCEEKRGCRLDFLIQPTQKLIELGWEATFGIECKRTSDRLGKAVCQCLDYKHAVFLVGGTRVYPEYLFLWPLPRQTNAIESVMTQNNIGTAEPQYGGGGIVFKMGSTNVIHTNTYKAKIVVRPSADIATGKKVGSR